MYNIYASYAREKGAAFPYQEKITKTLKISIPTLIEYDKILEEDGPIKVEKRKCRTNLVYLLKLFKKGSKTALEEDLKELKTKENSIKENTNEVNARASTIDVFEYFKKRIRVE